MTNPLMETLISKPRPYLEGLTIALWKGGMLFNLESDKRTSTKEKLVAWLASEFPEVAIQAAMDRIDGRESAHCHDGLASALASVVQQTIGKAVDREALREIVKEEVDKLPAMKLEIVVNQKSMRVADGYARPEFQDVLVRAMNRLNVLMVGPAGCGKTFLAKQASEAMGLRFGAISCSAGMSESHLTGWLLPRGEQGKFEYTPSVFVDIYENGGVFLFDEIDAADSNTLLFVNQALANGGFFLPQRWDSPEVKRHPDCVIMGAANTYGTGGNLIYAGRERLDESTLDRFRAGVVEVGYDETLEKTLVNSEILVWGRSIRGKIAESRLSRVMSTRFLIDASRLKRAGVDMKAIKKTYFNGWREDEKRKVA